ncbi:MAG: enoyl-CoA hydratase/isomerase family protein [Gemmatimonadetes bacterium]|nr:enoyl-CoA hydratase/isomerase family protein [Gemmatimonadota bacterium]
MPYDFLELRLEGEVASLTLNRPPANLLHMPLMEELNSALLSLRGNRGLEVLLLRGAGGVFCEGLELQEHRRERVQRTLQVYSRIFETIRMLDVIAVAAVEGRALGSGFELALICNLIVAADTATFALPEVGYGRIPPIASIVLPRVTPRRKAMEWIITGNSITAAELAHYGLVNRVLPVEGFDARLAEFLAEITSKSGPILQLAKRAQYEAYYSAYDEALFRVQNLYLRDLVELEDAEEGVRARLEGREPQWSNR